MEASVTRFVVVSDILTGLILLSCPSSTPPLTLSKVGTVTHIKKWELALTETSCLLQDNVSSVECALLAWGTTFLRVIQKLPVAFGSEMEKIGSRIKQPQKKELGFILGSVECSEW